MVSTRCTICGFDSGKLWEGDACPSCGARTRHRQVLDVFARIGNPFVHRRVLANYANTVEQEAFLSDSDVLNFDVRPVRECDVQMDIQQMSAVADASFDAFLAIHVLNHVADDRKALEEIHRVLKPGGLAVLTIPYREDHTTSSCDNPAEHYGAEALTKYGVGTYRRYGLQDAVDLFRNWFQVRMEEGLDPVTGERMNVFFLQKAEIL